MKKTSIVIMIFFCLIFVSCCGYIDQAESENNMMDLPEKQADDMQEYDNNYQTYAGVWSEEGKSHESIINQGGTEFVVEITENNELIGYLYSQQEISGRIAEIKDIVCSIEDEACYYPYTDDGWGNSGILCIQFQNNLIEINVENFVLGEENMSGFGIDRTYILVKPDASLEQTIEYDDEQLLQYEASWSAEQTQDEIRKRAVYFSKCSYYEEVLDFLENNREVRDISLYIEPLYYSDKEYYAETDFADVPLLIIHLAKNEIYARHGYIFKDEDLSNYFMGQLWYLPSVSSEEFDDNIFNDIEKKNLELFSRLDFYKK